MTSPSARCPDVELAACVLAAGAGRRMGTSKALLEFGGGTYLQHLLDTFRDAGIASRFVVARDATTLGPVCLANDARLLVNPQPEDGMLSSIHVCLEAIRAGPGVAGLFVAPVDCPRVRVATIVQLAAAFEASRAPIVLPRFAGRRGHPVLFAADVFDDLAAAPLDLGARAVVWAHAGDVLEVDVDDAAVLDDVDTPTDAARLDKGPHCKLTRSHRKR